MPPTFAAQLDAFSLCLERLYTPVEVSEFPSHVLQVVGSLMPGTCAAFDEIDHATGEMRAEIINASLPDDPDYGRRAAANLEREHPGIAFLRDGGVAPVLHLSQFISARQFRQTRLYDENYKPFGISYEAAVVQSTLERTIALVFGRDRDFKEDEIQQLEWVAPHILRAHANVNFLARLRTSAASSGLTVKSLQRARFTPREAEVAMWLVEGKRDAEIAIILNCSPRTIEKHVQHVLGKLGVTTRSAAVALLIQRAEEGA